MKININPEDHSGNGWFSEQEVLTTIKENRQTRIIQDSIDKVRDDDQEINSILKGFAILRGEALDIAS
ncbi:MAG: hypothetical protein ACXWLH_00390 [Candidatus Saccharimonadales bacterium]